MTKPPFRAVAVVLLALGIVGTSCGSGGGDASTAGTTSLQPATSHVTIAPTTTTQPPSTTAGPQPEHEYIVEEGDLPLTIAAKFNVLLDDLMALNEWVLEGQYVTNFPPVGTPIRIPAGGTLPGETLPSTTVASTQTTAAVPRTTLAEVCAPGEYTIEAGDYPLGVADKFDTTLDALNAINVETPGYASFAVGLVIKIPAKTADC